MAVSLLVQVAVQVEPPLQVPFSARFIQKFRPGHVLDGVVYRLVRVRAASTCYDRCQAALRQPTVARTSRCRVPRLRTVVTTPLRSTQHHGWSGPRPVIRRDVRVHVTRLPPMRHSVLGYQSPAAFEDNQGQNGSMSTPGAEIHGAQRRHSAPLRGPRAGRHANGPHSGPLRSLPPERCTLRDPSGRRTDGAGRVRFRPIGSSDRPSLGPAAHPSRGVLSPRGAMPTAVWVVLTFVVLGEMAPVFVTGRAPNTFIALGGALWLAFVASSPL